MIKFRLFLTTKKSFQILHFDRWNANKQQYIFILHTNSKYSHVFLFITTNAISSVPVPVPHNSHNFQEFLWYTRLESS